jgi:HK97 family phage prohead protease
MTDTLPSLADIAARRAAAAKQGEDHAIPSGKARLQPFKGEFRAKLIEQDGKELHQLDGIASVTDRAYEMWDLFGPYNEIIEGDAFDETLAANPDVAFLVNHRGVTMARTTNGSLELSVDGLGLHARAFVNPKRQDVRDLVVAIDDKDITEMSFAFIIEDGEWNDDFTEFRIKKVNLDRGDVSAVNYGANPYTSIGARAHEILADLDHAPVGVARAAFERLGRRTDLTDTTVKGSQTPTDPTPPSPPADQTGDPVEAPPVSEATAEPTGLSTQLARARLAMLTDE